MPRGPRYLPPEWSVEVTTRTICGFYLLPATRSFARTMVGILGKAQEKYPVQIHAAVAASNHAFLKTPSELSRRAWASAPVTCSTLVRLWQPTCSVILGRPVSVRRHSRRLPTDRKWPLTQSSICPPPSIISGVPSNPHEKTHSA